MPAHAQETPIKNGNDVTSPAPPQIRAMFAAVVDCRKEAVLAAHQAGALQVTAAEHLRTAADYAERAADHYSHGAHEQAAHFALLAHAHMQHAGQFMSDAAKVHAELHGGNRHTLIG